MMLSVHARCLTMPTLPTKIHLSPDAGSLLLDFASREAAQAFLAEAEKQAGFFLNLDRELAQFSGLEVVARAPNLEISLRAEIMQVFPAGSGYGIAFQLVGWNAAKKAELARLLRAADAGDEPPPSELSPIFKIRQMNPVERFRLAGKASRVERQILLRDNSPQVLMGLLNHPRLENKELLELLKSPFATANIMQRVADNRKWMSNPEIQLLVARSPKTPTPVAIKFLPHLSTKDLGMLSKNTNAREALRKAALRIYLKRVGKG
jgi:hypothetical protein